jgi:ribosomal protein S27E
MSSVTALHEAGHAIVTRILSNGWQLVRCDRCGRNLVDSAECYQVEIDGTAWIVCPKCHGRNQREQVYARPGAAAVTMAACGDHLACAIGDGELEAADAP